MAPAKNGGATVAPAFQPASVARHATRQEWRGHCRARLANRRRALIFPAVPEVTVAWSYGEP